MQEGVRPPQPVQTLASLTGPSEPRLCRQSFSGPQTNQSVVVGHTFAQPRFLAANRVDPCEKSVSLVLESQAKYAKEELLGYNTDPIGVVSRILPQGRANPYIAVPEPEFRTSRVSQNILRSHQLPVDPNGVSISQSSQEDPKFVPIEMRGSATDAPSEEGSVSLQFFRRIKPVVKTQVGPGNQLHIVPLETPTMLVNYESLSRCSVLADSHSGTQPRAGGSKIGLRIKMRVPADLEKSFSQTNKHSKNSVVDTNASSHARPKISGCLRLAGSAAPRKSMIGLGQSSPPPASHGLIKTGASLTSSAIRTRRNTTCSPTPCAGDSDDAPSFPKTKKPLKDLRLFQIPQDTGQAVQSSKQKLSVTGTSHDSDGLFLPKKLLRYETHAGGPSLVKLQGHEIGTPDKYKTGPVCFLPGASEKSSRDDLDLQPLKSLQRGRTSALRAHEIFKTGKSIVSHDHEIGGLIPTFTMQNVSWEGHEEANDEDANSSKLKPDSPKLGKYEDSHDSGQLKLDTNPDLEEMVRKCSVLNKRK